MTRSTEGTKHTFDTFDVVSNFIKGYLTNDWHNKDSELQLVLHGLRDISGQLRTFIKGNQDWRQRFPQMVNCFIDCDYDRTTSNSDKDNQEKPKDASKKDSSSTPDEDHFDSIFEKFSLVADGLFEAERIYEWYSIILFLTYAAEVASHLEKKYNDEDDEEGCHRCVSHITACIAQYIDENLLEWIESQDLGWLSLRDLLHEEDKIDNSMKLPEWAITSKYATMGALFAIAAGLYIGSKFAIH